LYSLLITLNTSNSIWCQYFERQRNVLSKESVCDRQMLQVSTVYRKCAASLISVSEQNIYRALPLLTLKDLGKIAQVFIKSFGKYCWLKIIKTICI